MRSFRAALLCALLFLALTTGSAPIGAQPTPAEEIRLEADIEGDGDARWSVVVWVPLESESDVESFEAFGEGTASSDFSTSVAAFKSAAGEASDATEREMEITNVTREWEIHEDPDDETSVGELRLSFTWTNFAREVDGELVVGDAFNTTDGTWLPGLAENQMLVLKPPEGYGVTTSPVPPEGGELRWLGPAVFPPGYFEIVYQPGAGTGVPQDPDYMSILLVGALILSGAALALGLYLLWRRREDAPEPPETTDTPNENPVTENGIVEQDDEINPELLSDEERVERLLERNGGRMKQARIVEETDWSNAKVSQLLSSMAEDDRVEKLRIGRENLISLPGEAVGEFDERE